ncbi:MAG: hypothetical protein QOG20_6908 [Pseudonocardiales bacterium]|nr:hypothetical protein [Pseudonocardiales bacterium]
MTRRAGRRLLPLLGPGMLVLLARGFDKNAFFAAIDDTGAALPARARSHRVPPVSALLLGGSSLSELDGLTVRVIEAVICVRSDDTGYARDRYRLVTTLLDPHRYPAEALIRLYHERWEIESAFYALRHTMLDGVVLRSHDRAGLEQETWEILTLYQLLRRVMVTAIETRPGLDPGRAHRGDRGGDTRPVRATTITAIDITVLAPPPDQMTRHAARRPVRQAAARLRGPDHRPAASERPR